MHEDTQPTPLISCIMPTAGRRVYLAQSIQYFHAQDYPRKELIIVEDGPEMNGDLAGADIAPWPKMPDGTVTAYGARPQPDILYHYSPGRLSIGEKRNLACGVAKGDILCHWDDDDYYGPQRLSRQAFPLLSEEADVSAMHMSLLYNTVSETLWRCSPAEHARLFAHDVRSGTLMYWAKYWRYGVRYNPLVRGEDVGFLLSLMSRAHARLEAVVDPESYVCIRHTANSSDAIDTSGPEWSQIDPRDALPPEALAFYRRQKVSIE